MKSKNVCSIFLFELGAYGSLVRFIHAYGEQWSTGILWVHRVRYALDENNKVFSGNDLDYYERAIGPQVHSVSEATPTAVWGRLAQAIQVGNSMNQRLLSPVHDWLMNVLKRLPMDGTFHQS